MTNIKDKPLVSVIIPCYNQVNYLKETVGSVLQQTLTDWECIIVNDGSTDDTEQIANELCKLDRRIKLVNKKNGGLSSARNAGMKNARGVYLQFLDSDDFIMPGKLMAQVNEMECNQNITMSVSKYHLCEGSIANVYDTRFSMAEFDVSKEGILYGWGKDFTFPPACYLVRSDFLDKNNISFNEDLKACEDWYFLVQNILANGKLKVIDNFLVLYRQHNGQMTKSIKHMIVSLMKASFSIYDILPVSEKQIFSEKISSNIHLRFETAYRSTFVKARSHDYKIGKIILTPYRLIKKYIWNRRK